MRYLFYSHDGMGLGHTRRHLAVAEALTELSPEATILLVTGANGISRLGLPPNVEILKLPSIRKVANGEYSSRSLGVSPQDIRELRSKLLLTAVKIFQPTVVLVDKHPFGAGGEFKAGLKALRRQGGRAALGLRDILDEPAHVLSEWRPFRMQHRIAKYYDEVFIYGQRAILDPIEAYQFPPSLVARTRFCGYVVNRECTNELVDFRTVLPDPINDPRPIVLATAGGGEDGFALLESFMHAAAGAPWHGLVVAGPMTPDPEMRRLTQLAVANGVTLRQFVPQLPTLFKSVAALVSMGGYNTIAEAVSQGVPTVCVPRITPRTEQLIRAEAFQRLGLLHSVHPSQLDPQALRDQIAAAIATPRNQLLQRANQQLRFDGAQQAARNLLELAATVTLSEFAVA
ncbi:MAG: glycosyltransferase [Verrucomicrobiota bacterium]